jgi:hypothetical protein
MIVNKGVDLVGWRTCPKQKEWGPKRFLLTMKKIGRQAEEAAALGPAPMNPGTLTPAQRARMQASQEVRQGAQIYAEGTPECRDCQLSGGRGFGCHVFVDYPIDAVAERALFAFFEKHVTEERHPCAGIMREIIAKLPARTAWHSDRGPAGSLAELDAPLVKEWGFLMWKKRIDSAQILASLFFTQKSAGLIGVFARFWDEFIEDARRSGADFASSKTLQQLERVQAFYDFAGTAAAATENVFVVVEDDAPPSIPKAAGPSGDV